MAKKWIGSAIQRPGRIKNLAKRKGISTAAAASQASHSNDPSLRSAGILAKRFQKGGDLHGGATVVKVGSKKAASMAGRPMNLAHKDRFKSGQQDAREGF